MENRRRTTLGALLATTLVALTVAGGCKKQVQVGAQAGAPGPNAAPPPQQPYPQGPPPPPNMAPAPGFFCSSDADLHCPLAHCIRGACGGCSAHSDCKPGAICMATAFGLACVPAAQARPPQPQPAPQWQPVPQQPAPQPAPQPTAQWQPVPPAPAPAPAGGDELARARQSCVDKTNAYRARVGARPLQRRPDREACSDQEAASDAQTGRAHGAFGICRQGAQNECPGWSGAYERVLSGCLESMFGEGPGEPYSEHGHYLNMTSSKYTGVACGFHRKPDGSVWVVQNFF